MVYKLSPKGSVWWAENMPGRIPQRELRLYFLPAVRLQQHNSYSSEFFRNRA